MRLDLMTSPAVEHYLTEKSGIIIPIGSMEQHGPTGLIGTDSITAEVIGRTVGERLDVCVGPVIPVGMAHHHMGFPGSMTVRPSTLIALIQDWVRALSSHGFRNFLFVNGHGGNMASIQAAFYEIYESERQDHGAAAPEIQCRLCSWFVAPAVSALAREKYGSGEGQHATPSEIAVTQAVYPETADNRVLDPVVGPMGRFTDYRNFRETFPDGRMGSNPSLATVEDGHAFITVASDYIVQEHGAFLTAKP